ncbi:site-specific integrase, partial [Novacetimonas hansenii]|uniref:site-specific integrase n=1 Tax=Novacetimonas hansenii TaxID=436 RepID=UPI0039E92D38
MMAMQACACFLDWMADERRASPRTTEAYRGDLHRFLDFLGGHLGGEVDVAALDALSLADLRAWLAFEHDQALGPPPGPPANRPPPAAPPRPPRGGGPGALF